MAAACRGRKRSSSDAAKRVCTSLEGVLGDERDSSCRAHDISNVRSDGRGIQPLHRWPRLMLNAMGEKPELDRHVNVDVVAIECIEGGDKLDTRCTLS